MENEHKENSKTEEKDSRYFDHNKSLNNPQIEIEIGTSQED